MRFFAFTTAGEKAGALVRKSGVPEREISNPRREYIFRPKKNVSE